MEDATKNTSQRVEQKFRDRKCKKQGSWAFNKIPGEKEGNIEEMGIKVKIQKSPDLKKNHIKNTSSWRKKSGQYKSINKKVLMFPSA